MKRLCSRFFLEDRIPRDLAQDVVCADERQGEQGFMLVGLIVAIFIILLVLSIAAPKAVQGLRREKEVEAVHRGNQYVRAIQLYYRKNNTYPGTMDALAKGTPVKYLRQEYVDPFTGKSDWRLIHVGEAKTTVKGFFGQPLTGLAPGLGSAAGQASTGGIGAGAAGSNSAFGSSSGSAFGSSGSSGSSAFGGSSGSTLGGSSSAGASLGSTAGAGASGSGAGGSTATGATTGSTDNSGTASTGTGAPSTLGSAAGIASQSSGGFSGGGAPFVGVGIPKEGTSIKVLNEQTSYNTWEFIYDPRIEQMKAAAGLLGGGNQGLGSAGSLNSGVGGAGTGTSSFGSSGSSSFGSSSGSAFGSSTGGSSSGSSFGSSSGSSFGSSPTSGTQGSGTTTPTTPQQPQ
ncbi:type II secretion system protein [Tunturibacter empetritectus]|uniref:Type II secretion system protein n=1 Tax=Tunturiibacter empetritectus TaxID=3069691 RepID=A0AAU7Z9K2_9BACT